MGNSGHWLPNQDLLWQYGQIFLAELAVDVAKLTSCMHQQVEEMDSSGHWLPRHDLLQCGQVFLAGLGVDVAKLTSCV